MVRTAALATLLIASSAPIGRAEPRAAFSWDYARLGSRDDMTPAAPIWWASSTALRWVAFSARPMARPVGNFSKSSSITSKRDLNSGTIRPA
jgi:hypothetical protein